MPLTDLKIRSTKPGDKPIKLPDGHGLYLEVRPTGSKLWRYRYKIAGKENTFAIGEYPAVTLQDARQAREEARAQVKAGIHPAHARQAALAAQVRENGDTFQAVAKAWIEAHRGGWGGYYLRQIESYMERDVYPKIGSRPVRSLTAMDMRGVVDAVTKRGAKTAAINVRTWCSAAFCYAVNNGMADSDPAATLAKMVRRDTIQHAEPMSTVAIGKFRRDLEEYGGLRTTALALQLMLYTFVRTIEMRRGEWREVRLDDDLWVIDGAKMKMRRTHMVPLSRQAKAILEELKTITGGGALLFPNSRRPAAMMSATTVNRAMEYLGIPYSGHDFRATASTHLYEMGWTEDVVEMQLAHAEKKKSKAAYNHAKHLDRRRIMMQAWADWIDAIPTPPDSPRKR